MGDDHSPAETDPSRRRNLIIAAALLAVAVAVAAALVLFGGDDEPSATDDARDASSTTAAAAAPGSDDPTTSSPGAGPASDDPADDPGDGGTEVSIPVGAITGTGEVEVCAAILVRIGEYRTIAEQQLVMDQTVIDALGEFSDEVFTLADNQDWGDRIIEDLTSVRREWATAASAQAAGDTAEAEARAAQGIEELDRTIERAQCPTA